MNKKGMTVLSAICFFAAAIIFFVMAKNITLGICFTSLGVGAIVRALVLNKNNNDKNEK